MTIPFDVRDGELPLRQREFLAAVGMSKPVVRNAATRKALRDRDLISIVGMPGDWQCLLSYMGRLWLYHHPAGTEMVCPDCGRKYAASDAMWPNCRTCLFEE